MLQYVEKRILESNVEGRTVNKSFQACTLLSRENILEGVGFTSHVKVKVSKHNLAGAQQCFAPSEFDE